MLHVACFHGTPICQTDTAQVLQNKCIRFCQQLGNRDHIGIKEFQTINWLPVNDRFLQQAASNAFKFFHSICPTYMSELFDATNESHITTRSSLLKLKLPFCNQKDKLHHHI